MGKLQGAGEGSEDHQGGGPSMAEGPKMRSWATMLQPELPHSRPLTPTSVDTLLSCHPGLCMIPAHPGSLGMVLEMFQGPVADLR